MHVCRYKYYKSLFNAPIKVRFAKAPCLEGKITSDHWGAPCLERSFILRVSLTQPLLAQFLYTLLDLLPVDLVLESQCAVSVAERHYDCLHLHMSAKVKKRRV